MVLIHLLSPLRVCRKESFPLPVRSEVSSMGQIFLSIHENWKKIEEEQKSC